MADLLGKIGSEIDSRLREVRPLVEEYERLQAAAQSLDAMDAAPPIAALAPARRPRRARRGSAAGALRRAASGSAKAQKASRRKPRSAPISRSGQAVLDALDHGSHTVSELVMVTAMAAREIRSGVRRLLTDGSIVKVDREGKTAYALPPRPGSDAAQG
jgi:hypothetical protein